jgi:hypothetical protein
MNRQAAGTAIAMAVAGLFASTAFAGDPAPAPAAATVKCSGVNSCKAQGSCSGATNSCKGQNACKGQGWTTAATEKECTDKGGKVVTAATTPPATTPAPTAPAAPAPAPAPAPKK